MPAFTILIYIAIMAGITYACRVIPLALFRKQVQNQFLLSFLFYTPYAVLGAMTFPAVLYSTNSLASALVGLAVGLFLAWKEKDLLTVATCSCIAVLITQWIGSLF